MAKSTNTKQMSLSNSAVCGVLGHCRTNESLISRCDLLFTGIKYRKLRSQKEKTLITQMSLKHKVEANEVFWLTRKQLIGSVKGARDGP